MARHQPQRATQDGDCRVAAQVIFVGYQESKVRAVAAEASADGSAHVAVRIGRLLFYICDRESFTSWAAVWQQVEMLVEKVFPEDRDAIWEAKQADRRYFEATGQIEVERDRDARSKAVPSPGSKQPTPSSPLRR